MRFHRFYIKNPISGKTFDISDRDMVHQWRNVFRYNVGSQVILFDGSGTDYLCIVTSLRNLGGTVSVLRETKTTDLSRRKNIWLCMALTKKDNFELVVQKATEIGVSNIIPILCEHSEKKKINLERLQKIAIESSEQSGRGDVPVIYKATTLSELFQSSILPQDKMALHPEGEDFKRYIAGIDLSSIAVFIGPEGGFSPKEIDLFKSYNIPLLSLGSQILRAETAVIAVSSLLLL